jgi:SAM-dependent methyltransferase
MVRDPFARSDPSSDARFYALPRRVVHIEAGAIEALRDRYADLLPAGAEVLDLMSSWRSHLPEGLGRVTGLGMNAAEMADNPQLDHALVADLNAQPRLPFDDAAFDAVVCAVSVQYLTRPIEVFADVRRVLRPGGPVVVSFSNRCFPTKAVAVWLHADDAGHRAYVRGVLEEAGLEGVVDEELSSPDDPLFVVRGARPA